MSTAFRVKFFGAEVVPGVSTGATGLGTLVFDSVTTSLSYTINMTGLDWGAAVFEYPHLGGLPQTGDLGDDVTGAHFHDGARGANGAAAFDWQANDADDFRFALETNGSWTLSGNWETADSGATSISTFAAALAGATLGTDGPLYADAHTTEYPDGEIRSQLFCIATDNSETITGTAEDDLLPGLGGNDAIDGGAGLGDRALYSGNRANYTIVNLGGHSFQITDNRPGSPDGTDTLTNVEFAQFADLPFNLNGIDLRDVRGGAGGFVIYGEDGQLGSPPPIGDRSGYSVASAGDVNGDGFDDLIIGTTRANGPGNTRHYAGDSYVVFGTGGGFPAAIDLRDVALGTGGFVIHGENGAPGGFIFGDVAGYSVSSAGDINGDGFADLIIGAYRANGPGNTRQYAGDSYVVFGHAGGFAAEIDLADVTLGIGGFVVHGQDANDKSGYSVASVGDINGDGFADIIIGAREANGPGNTRDRVGDSYVIFGHAGGFAAEIDLATVAAGSGGFVMHGKDPGSRSGFSVASAGDINGDGFDELIIGAVNRSYVVFGHAGGFPAAIDLGDVEAGIGGFVMNGRVGDNIGPSVASAGDINGDGFDDLIIAAPGGDGPSNRTTVGNSYVVFGHAGGFPAAIDLRDVALGVGGFIIYGQDRLDGVIHRVASAGDVNGDGFDDLIIGHPFADGPFNTRYDAGDVHVVFGHAGAFAAAIDLVDVGAGVGGFVIHGEDTGSVHGDKAGISVASAGDVDGDGFDDLLIGASDGDGPGNTRPEAGDSYVVFGSATITGSDDHVTHAGTSAAETLTGDAGVNVMVGGRGNDILLGNGGADVLIGGEGNDTLTIGDASFARVVGGNGNDVLAFAGAITLADSHFRKVEGIEGIKLANATTSLTLGAIASHAIGGLAANSFQITIDASLVTSAAVTVDGSGLNRGLTIDLSNDTTAVSMTGGAGDDVFKGGTNDDTLTGNAGDDTLFGEAGTDTVVYLSARANYRVDDLGGGLIQIIDLRPSSPDGTDTLQDIESFIFSDGTFNSTTVLNDPPTGAVTITGTATEDQVLTANSTLADPDGLGTLHYQWQRNGVTTVGTDQSAYTPGDADVGATIRVIVSYTDGHGSLESVASLATGTVANVNDLPTGIVTITGTATEDQTLTASNTLADADGLGTISYKWQRNGVDIGGATAATYTLGDADVGTMIRVVARYTDGHGALESVSSGATAAVTNVNDAPTITSNGGGSSASIFMAENSTAATTVTAADVDGPSISYSINGGADAGKFQIGLATGLLAFIGAPRFDAPTDADHNNSYIVEVLASDGSLLDTQTITVNVTDVNDVFKAPSDFNADANGDILWRTDDGHSYLWLMNGVQNVQADVSFLPTDPHWHIDATGDFTGDGKSDILGVNDNGWLNLWAMDGAILTGGGPMFPFPQGWHLAGVTDFNGDHKADVLGLNDNGWLNLWQMDGTAITGGGPMFPFPQSWHLASVADFNGDGKADVLGQNDNGWLNLWQMDGAILTGGGPLFPLPGGWHLAGTGDFNGDHKADILGLNDNGWLNLWEMDGTTLIGGGPLYPLPVGWHVADIADFNGDSKADILGLNDNGSLNLWLMDGTTLIGGGPVATPPPGWHMV